MAMTSDFFVLVVDDEIDIAEIFSETLAFEEFQTTFKTDPLEALEFIKANKVDAILCDSNMPGMKGLELLAQLKEAGNNSRFYLCTGDIDANESDIKNQGGHGLIMKPFSVADVVTRLKADFGIE